MFYLLKSDENVKNRTEDVIINVHEIKAIQCAYLSDDECFVVGVAIGAGRHECYNTRFENENNARLLIENLLIVSGFHADHAKSYANTINLELPRSRKDVMERIIKDGLKKALEEISE